MNEDQNYNINQRSASGGQPVRPLRGSGEYYDDEITLKELILKLQEFWRELWSNWWKIALVAIPFVAHFGYQAISHVPTYNAKLTFMVNEEKGGGGMAGLGGLASSFGLNIGGGGGGLNMNKVMALTKTKKITQRAIFQKAEINGKIDHLANHIIDVYDMHQKWEEGYTEGSAIDLRGFRFDVDTSRTLTLQENAALNAVFYQLHGGSEGGPDDQIFSGGQDEDTGIMNFSASTPQEALSIAITKALYTELSTFYVDKAIEPQLSTMETVKAKCDSLLSAFNKSTYAAAAFEEGGRSVFSATANSRKARLQADIQISASAYGECVKNREMADFSLKSARPVFQVIDNPTSPISPSKESLIKNLIIGGFLGCFLGAGWIVARKIYRDAMSSPGA